MKPGQPLLDRLIEWVYVHASQEYFTRTSFAVHNMHCSVWFFSVKPTLNRASIFKVFPKHHCGSSFGQTQKIKNPDLPHTEQAFKHLSYHSGPTFELSLALHLSYRARNEAIEYTYFTYIDVFRKQLSLGKNYYLQASQNMNTYIKSHLT